MVIVLIIVFLMLFLSALIYRWIAWHIPPPIPFFTFNSISASVNSSNTNSVFFKYAVSILVQKMWPGPSLYILIHLPQKHIHLPVMMYCSADRWRYPIYSRREIQSLHLPLWSLSARLSIRGNSKLPINLTPSMNFILYVTVSFAGSTCVGTQNVMPFPSLYFLLSITTALYILLPTFSW